MPRIIDLSHPLHTGMTSYPRPWHPPTEITQLASIENEGRETRRIVIGSHNGTHLDAPAHFIEGGARVDELDLDALVGQALLLDMTDVPESTAISAEDLDRRLAGRSPERLVLRFDWSERFDSLRFYEDHPYLSEGAARLLVDRGVRLLGLDTPTPDSPTTGTGDEPDSPVHKILLGAGVILLEYLANLSELSGESFWLIAAPLRIVGGDGAPLRAVAVEQ